MRTAARAPGRLGLLLIALGAAARLVPPVFEAFRSAPTSRSACCWSAASRCLPGASRCCSTVAPAPRRRPRRCSRSSARAACAQSAAMAVSGVVARLEPCGGADGDGRELSRFGDALARRGAAGRPVRARAAVGPGGGDVATLPQRLARGRSRDRRRRPRRSAARRLAAARSAPPAVGPARARDRRPARACRWSASVRGGTARARSPSTSAKRGRSVRRAPRDDRLRCRFGRRPAGAPVFVVAGVWRDYVRQSGAIAIERTRLRAADRRPARQRPAALAGAWGRRRAGAARHSSPGRTRGRQRSLLEFASAQRDRAPRRCASSTAASPSPTGCRRWRSASACSASPRASARRCWRGARSSACSRTWA